MIIKGSGRNIIPFFYARKLPVAGAALSNNVWLSLSFDSDPYRGNNVWLINGPNIICNPDHVQIHGKKIIKKKN